MPDLEPAQTSQLSERRGTHAEQLLWLVGKNRATGADESMGLWTGDDHQTFEIDGQSRTYFGAGAVLQVPPVQAGIGLTVRHHRITLPPMLDEVRQALRGYEPRLAKVELHVATFDIDTGNMLGAPKRMIKGVLNGAPEEIGPIGGRSSTELVIASPARALTFGLPLLRSNDELQLRDPSDMGREYSDAAGEWSVPWGELDA